MKNSNGIDSSYFKKELELVIRDINDYIPSELARELARLAKTSNAKVLTEKEFSHTSKKCTWTQDDEESNDYSTGCGRGFLLNEGSPEDNDIKFCFYCGKKIEQVLHEDDDS